MARGAHLTAIQKNGLKIVHKENQAVVKIKADHDPAQLGPQDAVVVAVKAQNLPEVAAAIAPLTW